MTSSKFQKKLDQVFIVPPNDLGITPVTMFYKIFTKRLKTAPFIILVPLSFIFSVVIYLLIGLPLVKLASLLQYGF